MLSVDCICFYCIVVCSKIQTESDVNHAIAKLVNAIGKRAVCAQGDVLEQNANKVCSY